MLLKYSRFNHLVPMPEGGWALYNFRTGSCLKLSFLTKDIFDRATTLDPSRKDVSQLKALGFLVDFDELRHLKNMTRLAAGRTDQIGVCLCPTFDCNFDCPYCFEHRRPGRMSPETQDHYMRFLEKEIGKLHPGLLSVTWFGGEPLLAPDVIRDLSRRMIALCKEKNVEYTASIITNGWFLNQKNIELLEEAQICNIQVTLDGPDAATNDKTRKLRSGGGTFARIVENLRCIRTGIRIEVRCNLQRENADSYDRVKEMVRALKEETGNPISAYIGYLDGEISVHDTDYSAAIGMDAEEYSDMLKQKEKHPRLLYRRTHCIAQNGAGIAVDELGNLYKCWENIGLPEESFGNLEDFGFRREPDARIENLYEYLDTAWPEDDPECMECVLLPHCLGGCPHKRVKYGEKKCNSYRYMLDDYVINRCRYVYSDEYKEKKKHDGQ